MPGHTSITPRISKELRDRLGQRVAQDVERRRAFLQDPRWAVSRRMPAAERATVRAALRAHIADLRASGELLDTVDALMTHAVKAELTLRGWNLDWPPVPANAPKSGRWPGSLHEHWPVKINARIPADLATRVHAACYHTSKEAIDALRVWRDDHPEIVTPRSDPAAWREYQELADQVTTPGDIWRASLQLLLGDQ
ncbi:hypothetical protein ETD86_29550 [Nonomuraea turkmeniaca]|uniref:Uncharacterized protein n=1 Tax=Nonomuraea turkmeniaca TaxID=103838 RepID=A0A5S4F9Z8_9ACTN|nr:hypothetical protein [Nonomuraea turkmeniaca]TMR14093.1 hypothetical protein ETD86_29550 [Nonomuraea turkmeniaca]